MKRHGLPSAGFTLIEVLMAAAASAVIFAAIYGVFSRAVKLRDEAAVRIREAQLRVRAVNTLREDILNGYFSGANGVIAASLDGDNSSQQSSFPGHLRFTTTTGRSSATNITPDVQEVEYYIAADPDATDRSSGVLVRTTNDDLLATVKPAVVEQQLLKNVSALEVSFYDGQTWVDSWDATGSAAAAATSSTGTGTTTGTTGTATGQQIVPVAIRVRLRQGGVKGSRDSAPPLAEILVPWAAQPHLNQ